MTPIQELIFDEKDWDWKTDDLYSFTYKHNNIPLGYKEFFMMDDVRKELLNISVCLEKESKSTKEIYPPLRQVFRAFYLTPNPTVCILGQDPYINHGAACGLAFSVENRDIKINPSLINIKKEVENDGWNVNRQYGCLTAWANQGVLLLNSALTVKEGDSGSHTEIWVKFTEKLIQYLSGEHKLVWMLWGGDAMDFESDIVINSVGLPAERQDYIIKTSHPSPLSYYKESRGNHSFKESRCFSKCNEYLQKLGKKPIDWTIPSMGLASAESVEEQQ